MLRYLMSRYKEFEFLSPSLPFMEYISFGDGGGGGLKRRVPIFDWTKSSENTAPEWGGIIPAW